MRCLALALTMFPATGLAQEIAGTDWQLLATDGVIFEAEASLRFEADGMVGGKAPCNRWSAMNGAALPDLSLQAIRATRMACDKLAEEQAFFDSLSIMTFAAAEGDGRLILTGPEGRSMEFVLDRMSKDTICTTCPAEE